MKKIEAPTLEEAYDKAREELNCSISDLDFEIVQNPSKGFMGLFKKSAIIVARCKTVQCETKEAPAPRPKPTPAPAPRPEPVPLTAPEPEPVQEEAPEPIEEEAALPNADVDSIVDTFYRDKDSICREIEDELNALFAHGCFQIEPISVEMYDDKTVLVKFAGEDAALLIGKDGYRYKALSYMLFNWINPKYNLLLRLEIAEFLQNQEEMVRKYLDPVIETIHRNGKGQTKVLDGVLVQIALKELRAEFPGKYVAIKTAQGGGKFVVVNEFIRKHDDHHAHGGRPHGHRRDRRH